MATSSVSTCPAPDEGPIDFETRMREKEHLYRGEFLDREQYEFFMMLPIPDASRLALIKKMRVAKREQVVFDSADG